MLVWTLQMLSFIKFRARISIYFKVKGHENSIYVSKTAQIIKKSDYKIVIDKIYCKAYIFRGEKI